MTYTKTTINCRFCNEEFVVKVRNGVPESVYCSSECRLDDTYDDYDGETFEKFSKGDDEWR